MTNLNLYPSKDDIAVYGLLAHVDWFEKRRVLSLPLQQRERYMENLQKRLDNERKVKR